MPDDLGSEEQKAKEQKAKEWEEKGRAEYLAHQDIPFEGLALSGGGAKGAIYSGVFESLKEAKIIDDLKVVAGSSAGAIFGSFIASGISVDKYKEINSTTNFNDLQGKGGIKKDAKPLYGFIQNTINDNIATYFNESLVFQECENALSNIEKSLKSLETEEEKDILKERKSTLEKLIEYPDILKSLKEKSNSKEGKITFGDLKLLRVIDPKKFKELSVTATNKSKGQLVIFNADNTPNVEIALACRASASIPFRFKPVLINGEEYIDGGYTNNVPQDILKDQNKGEESQNSIDESRVLAMAFGSEEKNSPAHLSIYSNKEEIVKYNKIISFCLNVLMKFAAKIGGDGVYTESVNNTYQKLRNNSTSTVLLNPNISTLDFKKAQKKSEYLHIKGKLQTDRYLCNFLVGDQKKYDNLDFQEFALQTYEEINQGIITDKKKKALADILKLTSQESWKDKDTTKVMSGLIQIILDNEQDKKILNILNNRTTSSKIKSKISFMPMKLTSKDLKSFCSNITSQNNREEAITQAQNLREDITDAQDRQQVKKSNNNIRQNNDGRAR